MRKHASKKAETVDHWQKSARRGRKAATAPKLRGVRWVQSTTGSFLLYHRSSNTRLPDDWKSPAFKKAFDAAEKAYKARLTEKPPVDVLTVNSLIRQYEASPNWKRLSEKTKDTDRYSLKSISEEWGDMPLTVVEAKGSRKLFLEWHVDPGEENGMRAADLRLGKLQTLLKFAFDLEMIARNPLATFKRLHHADRSMVIWSPSHFAMLNASKSSVEMKLAAFAALHTGQRRGDLIAMKWSQYDGEGISVLQSKTKQHVYIKATKALKETLDNLLTARVVENDGLPVHDHHILLAKRGQPFTSSSFRQAWHRACEIAKIPSVIVDGKEFDLHFHDIRGTTVTMLAESGATIPEIASVTGHKLESAHRILERYLGRSKTLSSTAIDKLELKLLAASAVGMSLDRHRIVPPR